MSGWYNFIALISLVGWLLFSSAATSPASLEKEEKAGISPMAETLLVNLPDGAYQLCTEPDPQDWRDGAGVCLNCVKQGMSIDGYYGYPHSDSFVCLRGKLSKNWLYGEGMVISWVGNPWFEIPQKKFTWDKEERLNLSQGNLMHSDGIGEDRVKWIIFKQASLNMQGLYLYPNPRMTSPTQLCDWSFN
ncbi:hypothetical protein [Mastigocoleus sp. MO_188.B34]|uniref:hypothetical protein n=1 Tax=Mastigocoleus sp. MO_188.B34 TaxID=3036635 RepID=UPI002623D35E|nr:hypothetical protein [Mastigocoleus sp. MO_188.B34]MDJ0693539.1 hypothetical protein [Mastigocoleus sp. MO_188.B34]